MSKFQVGVKVRIRDEAIREEDESAEFLGEWWRGATGTVERIHPNRESWAIDVLMDRESRFGGETTLSVSDWEIEKVEV